MACFPSNYLLALVGLFGLVIETNQTPLSSNSSELLNEAVSDTVSDDEDLAGLGGVSGSGMTCLEHEYIHAASGECLELCGVNLTKHCSIEETCNYVTNVCDHACHGLCDQPDRFCNRKSTTCQKCATICDTDGDDKLCSVYCPDFGKLNSTSDPFVYQPSTDVTSDVTATHQVTTETQEKTSVLKIALPVAVAVVAIIIVVVVLCVRWRKKKQDRAGRGTARYHAANPDESLFG